MPHKQDDPAEVLALLNSLGFVGITAPQLKAFMKDLKLYRKMKDREKQQRKEEIRKKILRKQQCMIQELLNEHTQIFSSSSENFTSDGSNVCTNSFVEVKISHRSKIKSDEAGRGHENKPEVVTKSVMNHKNSNERSQDRRPLSTHQDNQIKKKETEIRRPVSAPDLRDKKVTSRSQSATSNQSENTRPTSLPATRTSSQSGPKSFIRPWRLQSDAQKAQFKKSDPVALYQKYQEQWKQIPFPGEEKHSGVRWAIREKMLGGDPHPAPLSRKSTNTSITRKR